MTEDGEATSERDLSELARRRGFYFQSSESYGGVAGFYTYGPAGTALKGNVEDAWRDRFVTRPGHLEVEAPDVMPEAVFEASGHLETFNDMIVDCPECGGSHRADHLIEDATDIDDAEAMSPEAVADLLAEHGITCPTCGEPLADEPVEEFNLMFETNIGPGDAQAGYLRPETAQGIFVEFPRLVEYARGQLPFAVAQIGAAYRNEISPRGGLLRLRALAQAELEQFVHPQGAGAPIEDVADVELPLYSARAQQDGDGVETWTVREAVEEEVVKSEWIAYYLGVAREWYARVGVDMSRFRFRQHLAGERSHYAADCWDAETEVSGPGEDADWIEAAGFAYRSDYDLAKHASHSGEDYSVFEQYEEPRTVERAVVDPDMSYLGPEFGGAAAGIADALAALAERDRSAFEGDAVSVAVDGEEYTVPVEKTGFEVVEETEAGEHVTPHVVEPSFGVDRTVYTLLAHNYETDAVDGERRRVLRLPAEVAPTTVGVFPLMNREGMDERAHEVAADLRAAGLAVEYDDSGNIGRRYRRQDEQGTPFCVTVDHETMAEDTVTVRERDSTEQVRVPVADLPATLVALRDGDREFEAL
jgi:glycyl-tRNA synthetase